MPKRKGSARTENASAARRKGGRDEEGEEPVLETNEPIAARLDDVPDSAERFDVAGFGELLLQLRLTCTCVGTLAYHTHGRCRASSDMRGVEVRLLSGRRAGDSFL